MIKWLIVFGNGMVMVFDQHGQQMPDYQGKISPELVAKIEAAIPHGPPAVPWIAAAWPRK